jgi:phosphatidylserine decarboxylase
MWRIVPKRAVSDAIGWGAARDIPRRLRRTMLSQFASLYGIDVEEAEKPLEDYAGFDDFFTRRLRPGARPIADAPDAIVSPADGAVVECGLAAEGKLIQAKGTMFSLAELLGDPESAARLQGGPYLITYLSPKDYHRVHAPVAGRVLGWRHLPGSLFSVNAKSVACEPGLFVRNERLVTLIEMEQGGLCAVVMVAAVGVGHMTASYDADVATHHASFSRAGVQHRRYEQPRSIQRGEELGIFHLGSTTIAVFEPGRVELSPVAGGTSMKMGISIGRVRPAGPAAVPRG